MGLTVGIDLGTTFSVAAYIDPVSKRPVVIKNKYGMNTTPSALVFRAGGIAEIGIDAKNAEESGDPNTASFYKLEMGHADFSVSFFGKSYTAAELSGVFLKELVAQAEDSVGQKIDKAVITVPAYFEDLERSNTMLAGQMAGLKVLSIINEPTAAAIAYGLRDGGADRNILIYDLGGGTFDVTLARVTGGSIDVIGSSGKHFLGGKNWDEAICHWAVERFEEEFGVSPADDPEEFNMLMVKAEKAKRALSSAPYADITVEYDGLTGKYRLTEQEFRDCTDALLDITRRTIDELLEDVKLTWSDVDGVILVGGSTRMKMVKEYVQQMTGKPPLSGVHPDEAVAIGAAIQASVEEASKGRRIMGMLEAEAPTLQLEDIPGAKLINDVIAHSLGMISVSADGQRFINDIMIRKNTPIKQASVTKRRELRVTKKEKLNELELFMLQGDPLDPLDCTVAKHYRFDSIPYVEGGRSMIDITYAYTENGTIDVQAVQSETGRQLNRQELDVPEDMSWVQMRPDDYFASVKKFVPATGVLYLALDVSGSMTGKPMQLAKKAMLNFVDKFDTEYVRIGVIVFSDRVAVLCRASSDREMIVNSIKSIETSMTGVCNEAEPVTTIYSLLTESAGEPFLYGVVLTDGRWDNAPCSVSRSSKKKFVQMGFELVALGFGRADERFLKDISTRKDLASVSDISQLDSRLSNIARVISEKTIG